MRDEPARDDHQQVAIFPLFVDERMRVRRLKTPVKRATMLFERRAPATAGRLADVFVRANSRRPVQALPR
jgi:hypothetical protein